MSTPASDRVALATAHASIRAMYARQANRPGTPGNATDRRPVLTERTTNPLDVRQVSG